MEETSELEQQAGIIWEAFYWLNLGKCNILRNFLWNGPLKSPISIVHNVFAM